MAVRDDIGAQLDAALQRVAPIGGNGGARRRTLRRWRVALAHVVSSEVTATMFTGQRLRVALPEIVGTQIYLEGVIEPTVSRVMIEVLRPGMVCFDVGAQYGYHSLLAALLVGAEGSTVAFEPARRTARLLQRNCRGVSGTILEPLAVGAASGSIEFHDFGERHSAVNTTLPTARVPAAERATLRASRYDVRMTSIDEYVDATGLVPDFVKIDAEGSEHAIVCGMRRLLGRASPVLSVETGDYDGMDAPPTAATIRALADLGYQSFDYEGALRPHRPRPRYGYGNLFFAKVGANRS
jgi:FkbM family methyltransferase